MPRHLQQRRFSSYRCANDNGDDLISIRPERCRAAAILAIAANATVLKPLSRSFCMFGVKTGSLPFDSGVLGESNSGDVWLSWLFVYVL